MATSTTNLGLIKPGGTDKIRIAQINQNMDIIDSAIGAAASGTTLQEQISSNKQAIVTQQESLAYIVGNTNTTGNTLAVGQFVYVKGHSTITEGLRTVTASISANGNITTSNTSACSEGGLNALNSNFTPSPIMASNIFTPNTGIEIHENMFNYKIGAIAIISFSVTKTDNSVFDGQRAVLGSLTSGWVPAATCIVPISGNITADSYVSGSPGNLLLISNNSSVMVDFNLDATPCKQLQIHAVYRVV